MCSQCQHNKRGHLVSHCEGCTLQAPIHHHITLSNSKTALHPLSWLNPCPTLYPNLLLPSPICHTSFHHSSKSDQEKRSRKIATTIKDTSPNHLTGHDDSATIPIQTRSKKTGGYHSPTSPPCGRTFVQKAFSFPVTHGPPFNATLWHNMSAL